MNARRFASLICIVLLGIQLAGAPIALAAEALPSSSPSTTTNSDGTISMIQTYSADEEAPLLAKSIYQDGQEYALENTKNAPDSNFESPTQHFTRTAFSQVSLQGINSLASYFPAAIAIAEGDFSGEIGLDAATPYTVVNRYEAMRQQVDRVQVYYDLPDNDVTRIPTLQSFVVSSSAAPGASETRVLQILDVSYSIAGTDYLGLPNNYTATVTYRGQEEYLELAFYDVTANYAGSITSSAKQMTTTGTYKPVEAEPAAIAQSEVPLAEAEIPLFPLAIASTVVVVFIATPLLFIFFLKNARLIRSIENNDKPSGEELRSTKKEATELICRRRLVLKDGMAELRIPANVDVFDGATYYLAIKPRLADKEGHVMLTLHGKILAVVPLARHTDINFKEMLITSVEAALIESDLLD